MSAEYVPCPGCDGCGQVTDNVFRIPWIWHTRELRDQHNQPLFPEATPTVCVECGGTGLIPRHKRTGRDKRKPRL